MSHAPQQPRGWRGTLRLRLLAGTLVWILATLAVAGWGLAQLFHRHLERQFHAELSTHLDQLAAALLTDGETPRLAAALSDPRFTRPYSGLYWQVDAQGPAASAPGVLRSRSLWDAVLNVPDDALDDGQLHTHRIAGPERRPLQMLERLIRPVDTPEQAWRLIVAADETLLSEPVARFTGQLRAALAVLAAGLVLAAVVQVLIGLRPLAELRRALAQVRDGRANAIEGRFPRELQPLVDDFNGALAARAEVVARARTQAGNLAHAVKTPLAVLSNAAAQESGPLAELVREQVALARTQVDHHLARARAAAAVGMPGLRTAVQPVLAGLLRVMARVHEERQLRIALGECTPDAHFRGEAQDLQEMLGNLLDNACKWAQSQVSTSVAVHAGQLGIVIDDDGPGLPEDAREAVFARGVRADEQTPGSGLGLAIVRDLAQLYGGTVELATSPAGGLRVILHLPAA